MSRDREASAVMLFAVLVALLIGAGKLGWVWLVARVVRSAW